MMSVFDKLKIKKEKKLNHRIHAYPGDKIVLKYNGNVVLSHTLENAGTFTRAVVVEGELDGAPALGGLFVGEDPKATVQVK